MVKDMREEFLNRGGELLGLPGVGKSWLLRNNAYDPSQVVIIPKGWVPDKVVNVIVGACLDSRLIIILITVLNNWRLAPFLRRLRSVLLILERLGRQCRGKRNGRNSIYDEGATQAVWGLWWQCEVNERNALLLARLLGRLIFHIGVVQYVTCSKSKHIARITIRNEKGGFDDFIRHSPDLAYADGRAWMARILIQLRSLNHGLLSVSNN